MFWAEVGLRCPVQYLHVLFLRGGPRRTVFSGGTKFYSSGLDLSTLEVRSVRRSHSGLRGTGRGSSWKWKLINLLAAVTQDGSSLWNGHNHPFLYLRFVCEYWPGLKVSIYRILTVPGASAHFICAQRVRNAVTLILQKTKFFRQFYKAQWDLDVLVYNCFENILKSSNEF